MDRKALDRDQSSQKTILRPLFKYTSMDSKSMEDTRNFPKAPGVTTLIRNMRGNLKVCDHLAEARDTFPNIKMTKLGSPELRRMSQMYAERVPVILHPCLYKTLKLSYPMDVSGIFLEGRIMSNISTGTRVQSVRVQTTTDFWTVCE